MHYNYGDIVFFFYLTLCPAPQTSKGADEFYQRKLDYVTENIEKMQKVLMEKHSLRESKDRFNF